ncbi:MAG: type 2 isopentenyl-diphosphate Delta-isomerase [Promethearchaeati archaeon SRVP18_Atabeyarchaeia-1]
MTSERKLDHIRICLTKDVQSLHKRPGFLDIELIHNALPEIDLSDVSTETEFFGKRIAAPLAIAGMTGGHPIAMRINEALAKAAQEARIAMGIGSQRAAIEDPSLEESYSIVRKVAPDIPIIANLGAPQLSRGYGIGEARKAVEMVEADALAIHLNPLQEAVQTEGETKTSGVLDKIGRIASKLDVPLIAKETGCGIAYEEACKLLDCNVKGVDVGGAGGTSWAAVEAYRELAQTPSNADGYHMGLIFRDWGIPTAASVLEVSLVKSLTIIATGGVRNGIDVAKSIALGANIAGVALPLLSPAYSGDQTTLAAMIKRMIRELRTSMYLTGSKDLKDLATANLVIGGELAEWVTARGIDLKSLAKRRSPLPKRSTP